MSDHMRPDVVAHPDNLSLRDTGRTIKVRAVIQLRAAHDQTELNETLSQHKKPKRGLPTVSRHCKHEAVCCQPVSKSRPLEGSEGSSARRLGVGMWPISYFRGAVFSISLLNLFSMNQPGLISNMHVTDEGYPASGDIGLLSISWRWYNFLPQGCWLGLGKQLYN